MTDVQEETKQLETASAPAEASAPQDTRVYPGAPAGEPDAGRPAGPPRVVQAIFVVSLVLVVIAAAYFVLHPSTGETARDDASLMQTTVGEEPQADTVADGEASADAGAAFGDAQAAGDAAAAQGDTASQDAATGGSNADAAGASGASGNTAAPGASGNAAPAPQAPATITVRVLVDSSAANGSVSADTTLTFEEGATAYDALCATGLSVNARNSGFGVYVAGIGGLAEFDFGGESGWKYSVNGSFPGHSCSAHTLHDGDVVKWVYVTSL